MVFIGTHLSCHVMSLFFGFCGSATWKWKAEFLSMAWVGTCGNGVIKGPESLWLGGNCAALCKENYKNTKSY